MIRSILAVAALLVPGIAHADWVKASSQHFVVYADDSPKDVREFTERLEVYDKALRELWGIKKTEIPKTQRVTIFQVHGVSDIRSLLPGRNAAGFYSARVSGPVAFVPQRSGAGLSAAEILRHEYAHQFMYSNWSDDVFPSWFSEGFAEFGATAHYMRDGSIEFGAMPRYRNFGIMRTGALPFDKLTEYSFEDLSQLQVAIAYARGWLLTHYLLTQGDERPLLIKYLAAVNKGEPADKAREELTGINDNVLNNYIQRKGLPSLKIDADKLDIGKVNISKLDPGEAAIMQARIRSTAGVNEDTAPEVAQLARSIAAQYPKSAPAQRELAEAEYDAKNYDASIAASTRAIADDPKMVDAYIYRGMAEMAKLKEAGSTDAAQWNGVRDWFLKANKYDTENPRALQLFFESYVVQGIAPTKNAQDALLYAYTLAPYDLGLRMEAGEVLLKANAVDVAKLALRPVAFSPHAGKSAAIVRKVFDIMKTDGTDKAVAYLDEQRKKAEEEGKKEGEDS